MDRRTGRAVPGGGIAAAFDSQAAKSDMAEVRSITSPAGQPDRDGLAVLWHGIANRSCYAMLGRDLLRLKRQPDADTYWIVRQPPGPLPETMKDLF